MRRKRYDGSDGRRVLTAMVINDVLAMRVASIWPPEGLFDNRWSNVIGAWCVNYAKEYHRAPREDITPIFETWAEATEDEKLVDSIEAFLYSLSDEFRDYDEDDQLGNSRYLADLAGAYFNKVKLVRTNERERLDLERGDIKAVEESRRHYTKVNLGKDDYVTPIKDMTTFMALAKQAREKPMVRFFGRLGDFFQYQLRRGELYSFLAPEKAGKTTWLIDVAFRALKNRKKVVFFDCGDSDRDEVNKRLGIRAVGRPHRGGTYDYPVEWESPDDYTDDTYKAEKSTFEGVDEVDAFFGVKKAARDEEALRVSSWPNAYLSVADIDGMLVKWRDEQDWRADVVVIDYADILAAPEDARDRFDEIDKVWKYLRRLSQQHHCLVVTATQASAASYNTRGLLSRQHFGERKTKLAHVNGMIGINVSDEDRKRGVSRLNWVVRRNDVGPRAVTLVGFHLAGNPAILSK